MVVQQMTLLFQFIQLTRQCFRDRPEESILRHLTETFSSDGDSPSSSATSTLSDAMELYFAKDTRRNVRLEMLKILGASFQKRRITHEAGNDWHSCKYDESDCALSWQMDRLVCSCPKNNSHEVNEVYALPDAWTCMLLLSLAPGYVLFTCSVLR